MRSGFDSLKWLIIFAAIVLSTIPHRVMSLNSVSPVCELSVIEKDKLYSYSLATPIPNFPHGVLSEDGYSSTLSLSLLFLSFSWSGYSLLFIVFMWNGNVFYYLIGMGLLGFLVLSWNMIWVLNIDILLSYLCTISEFIGKFEWLILENLCWYILFLFFSMVSSRVGVELLVFE